MEGSVSAEMSQLYRNLYGDNLISIQKLVVQGQGVHGRLRFLGCCQIRFLALKVNTELKNNYTNSIVNQDLLCAHFNFIDHHQISYQNETIFTFETEKNQISCIFDEDVLN